MGGARKSRGQLRHVPGLVPRYVLYHRQISGAVHEKLCYLFKTRLANNLNKLIS